MSEHSHGHDPHLGYDGYPVAHAEHGVGKYILVFVALCVLTGCSFLTYFEFWRTHLNPAVGWAFMMAVSCTKAGLVITFFMHLKYEADWKYVLTIPATIMSIFLTLALVPDVGLRVRKYSEERREFCATPADNKALVDASAVLQAEHGDRMVTRLAHPHGATPAGHYAPWTRQLRHLRLAAGASVRRQAGAGRSRSGDPSGRVVRHSGSQRRRQDDAVPAALHADPDPVRLDRDPWL